MLRLAAERPDLEVRWVVFGSTPQRAAEARASAADFLAGFRNWRLVVHEFRDGYLPYTGAEVKEAFEALKGLRARTSSSPTIGMTATRTTGWSPSSPGTPGGTT